MRLTYLDLRTLLRVRDFIDSNPTHPISITELTTMFGLSEFKLTRGFKRCFKTTIYRYHLGVAMHWAKGALDAGATVKEVAYMLGYKDDSNFRRAYKKVHGRYPIRRTKLQV